MKAMNEFFSSFKNGIAHGVNTAKIGVIDEMNGDLADVNVDGLPLLINLPTITTGQGHSQYYEGDKVLVVFLNSNVSEGVVVGRIQG